MTGENLNHIIRRANHLDICSMISLLKLLFSIETDFTFNEVSQKRGLEMMLDDEVNRCIMVAEWDQQIVGMCSAQLMVSTAEGGMSALIEDLIVDGACRGQGIGKKLLLSVESWAIERGASRLQLLADRNNTGALEFYQRMSWELTQMICLAKKIVVKIVSER